MSSPCASTQASASCGGTTLVLLCDLFDPRDQLEILLEVLTLKSRVLSPEIVSGEIINVLDLSGQESASERTVGDETDIEKAQRIEQTVLGIAGPE